MEVAIIKRILAILLSVLMLAALVGCKKNEPPLPIGSTPQQGGLNPTAPIKSYDFNPLTGAEIPEGYTIGQRPVAIMINNARPALPQRGVIAADVVYEMVTEGGVTRLMALFNDYRSIPQVGPVRSARDQHLQFALPANAIFVHIGSSIYASNLLNEYRYQDVDGMYLGTESFWFDAERNKSRSNEHCWYTDTALIAAGTEKQQIAPTGAYESLFTFVDKAAAPRIPAMGDAPDIKWSYSQDSEVEFVFDAASGLYMKKAYGEPHIDETTGAQLSFTNVFLLSAKVSLKPDGQCAQFDLSSGNGFYFYGGKYEEITWEKGLPEEPLRVWAKDGSELTVNIGKSYIGVLGDTNLPSLNMNASAPPPADPNAVAPADPNAAAPADPNAVVPADPNAAAPAPSTVPAA
ncbi:MAG: DUF3048 domain-containing protein [Oscillospiraceae bacterium]